MTAHQKERNEVSTLETIKARNNPLIDDRNNTISSAAPFQLDSPTKLENVMEIEELQRPEDSMLLKESGVSGTYMNDLDDIESVLSLQPEKLDLKNIS